MTKLSDIFATEEYKKYEKCKEIVSINGLLIKDMPTKYSSNHVICNLALANNGMALEYIPQEVQTLAMCETAIKQNKNALQFVKLKQMVWNVEENHRDYNPYNYLNELA